MTGNLEITELDKLILRRALRGLIDDLRKDQGMLVNDVSRRRSSALFADFAEQIDVRLANVVFS